MTGQDQGAAAVASKLGAGIYYAVGAALVAFALVTSGTSPLQPTLQRAIFLMALIVLAVLLRPSPRKLIWWDVLIVGAGAVSIMYLILNWESLAYRAQFEPSMLEYVLGTAAVLVTLEVTRRVVGPTLSVVALAAILYARFGNYLPEPFQHKGYSVARLLANQYLTHEGLFSSLLGIAATLVVMFILLGCLLQYVGVADLLLRISLRLSRRSHGGPAKLAVLASSLIGAISGSSTSNVVATGTTTIPLMKKAGFRPVFAGATEAVASAGGQLMPPVLGVAAFLMVEITGIPYLTIIIAALIPAVLYYLAVYLGVDVEARRLGLRGLDPQAEELKHHGDGRIWPQLYLVAPFFILIYLLFQGFSPTKAAFWSTVCLAIIVLPRLKSLLRLEGLRHVLHLFIRGIVTVGLACATAGVIVGALSITGASLRLSYSMVEAAGGSEFLLLVFVMVLSIILGLGLPTPAAYAVAASFAAPVLSLSGIPMLQAHLFVFYYACISSITPPVAIASFAAASIAGSSPMATALLSTKLALAAFLIPFMFVYDGGLLIGQAAPLQVLQSSLTAGIGVVALVLATGGYFLRDISWPERGGLLVGAFLLFSSELYYALPGLVLVGGLLALHWWRARRAALAPALGG